MHGAVPPDALHAGPSGRPAPKIEIRFQVTWVLAASFSSLRSRFTVNTTIWCTDQGYRKVTERVLAKFASLLAKRTGSTYLGRNYREMGNLAMRPPRWKVLVEKSAAAYCAAIEIYNKPVIAHREETFAILAVSAWELLLKARLLKEGGNKMLAIYETEPVKRRDGTSGQRRRIKRNRAGNPITISLGAAIHRVGELADKPLHAACRENLMLLTEIRDHAVHFMNDDRDLARKVHEVGTASIRNYVRAVGDWFDHDLGSYRFAVMPLSFEGVAAAQALRPAKRSAQTANLLAHMERACAVPPTAADEEFCVSLRIETKIVGTRSAEATPVKFASDPDAVKIQLTEDEFRRRWPHDYDKMVTLVRKRVPTVRVNREFHAAVKALRGNERFARDRRLDLNNPKSTTKKTYYSDAMIDALVARLTTTAGRGT